MHHGGFESHNADFGIEGDRDAPANASSRVHCTKKTPVFPPP
jgi:hypothetical protein